MIKCQNCTYDIKERLLRLKGDEEMIEKLKAWISENQQLIAFKNNDPLPQHLPTVEMLMREHEVKKIYSFYFYIFHRNRFLPKACKAEF